MKKLTSYFSEQAQIRQEDRTKQLNDKDGTNAKKDKMKREYINFICENTPWFVGDIVMCVTDLSNINLLATGGYGDKKIRLWDLKKSAADEQELEQSGKTNTRSKKEKKVDPKEEQMKKYFGISEVGPDL